MPKVIFITATGTEIGKTHFTCNAIKLLKMQNIAVAATKPIITGIDEDNFHDSDSAKILQALEEKITIDSIREISPFQYKTPAAPDIAAKLDKAPQINYDKLLEFTHNFIQKNQEKDYIFIEGVGGIMVPINAKKTIAHYLHDLNCNSVIIAGNYLGTISHSLTTIETAKIFSKKNIRLFLNNYPSSENIINNFASITNFTDIECSTKIKEILNY